jgi:hypothetical protein
MGVNISGPFFLTKNVHLNSINGINSIFLIVFIKTMNYSISRKKYSEPSFDASQRLRIIEVRL